MTGNLILDLVNDYRKYVLPHITAEEIIGRDHYNATDEMQKLRDTGVDFFPCIKEYKDQNKKHD